MRQKLYLDPGLRDEKLRALAKYGFQDLIYIYTCNRVEFYTTAPNYYTDTRSQWMQLLAHFGLGEEAFFRGYHLEGKSAVRHLLRVATSLESLVLGEAQILGQLKEAPPHGAPGRFLHARSDFSSGFRDGQTRSHGNRHWRENRVGGRTRHAASGNHGGRLSPEESGRRGP